MHRSSHVLACLQSAGLFHVISISPSLPRNLFYRFTERSRVYHQRPPLTTGRTELACPQNSESWYLILSPAAANHGPDRKILSSLRWETSPMSLHATDAVIGPGHASQPCTWPEPETGLNQKTMSFSKHLCPSLFIIIPSASINTQPPLYFHLQTPMHSSRTGSRITFSKKASLTSPWIPLSMCL